MEELPPPPPPWIDQYQRANLSGESALTTFQGLIVDELIVPRGALEANDPAVAAEASIAFVNSMQDEALFLPGEFAQEALWSYFALDYVTKVAQGGHVQYFQSRGDDDLALKLAQFGLKSMIADPHLALFTQFIKLQRAEPKEARKAALRAGYRSVDAAIRDFDRQLSELEKNEPIRARHKIWLKSLRKVRIVPDAEWREAIMRAASANPLTERRRVERDMVRAERAAADPLFQSLATMCDMAGLRFINAREPSLTALRQDWPQGPNNRQALSIPVATDHGPRQALFFADGGWFKKHRGVLIEPGQALPIADLTLSAQDYAALLSAHRV
jgi:hypothetical protein